MQTDIDALMENGLGQWLDDRSDFKSSARRSIRNRAIFGALAWAVGSLAIWFGTDIHIDNKYGIILLSPLAIWFWAWWALHKGRSTMKEGVNSAIASQLGLDYERKLKPGDEMKTAHRYGLIPSYADAKCEDHWHGSLDGQPFRLYETTITEVSAGGKVARIVFSGAIMTMTVARPFASTTLIYPAGYNGTLATRFQGRDREEFIGHTMMRVAQVDPDFDARFAVWGDVEHQSRSAITPELVQELAIFEDAFEKGRMRALMQGEQVIVTIKWPKMFEGGTLEDGPDADRKAAETSARQVTALVRLARAFSRASATDQT